MSDDAGAVAAAIASPRRDSQRDDDQARRGRSFRVIGPRELAQRARHRQAAWLVTTAAAIIVAALLVIAGAQALVASRQVHLDALESQLNSAVVSNQRLALSRAELGAPDRVLAVAESRLKMVAPGEVQYLSPVNPGPSVAQVAAGRSTAARALTSR
jgi:cell division protein FtsL